MPAKKHTDEEIREFIRHNFHTHTVHDIRAIMQTTAERVSAILWHDGYYSYDRDDRQYVKRKRGEQPLENIAWTLGKAIKTIKDINKDIDKKKERTTHFGVWQKQDHPEQRSTSYVERERLRSGKPGSMTQDEGISS